MRSNSSFSGLIVLAAASAQVMTCASPVPKVTVIADFVQPVNERLVMQIHQQLDKVLEAAGIDPAWLPYDLKRHEWIEGDVAVVKFLGTCSIEPAKRHPFRAGILAWTHSVDGQILPFIDVDCDRVIEFLRRRTETLVQAEREGVLSRALGRVVAHEMYHVLADTNRHAAWGLTKHALTVDELLDPQAALHPESILKLRSHFEPSIRLARSFAAGGR